MKRSKSSELGDRLSELPDALILGILSLLPMRDVVRTTVLSKRWKGLWTSVPCLLFDANTKYSEAFRKFVNRAMLHWDGTKLQKFCLNFLFINCSFSSDVDTWLHVAIKKGVEELYLDLKRDEYSPPQSLYSCSTIRKASLVRCKLEIKGDVQWSQLTSLRIELEWLSDVAIEKVLSGAPQMKILILTYVDCSGDLNIKSESLKRLKIERILGAGKNPNNTSIVSLRICTPNVETLEISGIPYSSYPLLNVSSLTRAKYGFYSYNHHTVNSVLLKRLFNQIRSLEKVTSSCWFIKKATMSGWFVKALQEIKKEKQENKDVVAGLSNVKFLRLYATRVDDVVDILELFPALTTLVLLQKLGPRNDLEIFELVRPSTKTCISEFDSERTLKPKSDCLLPYLRTVEIPWVVHDSSMFSLIEILSRNVRKLEKMVLRVTDNGSSVPVGSWLSSSQKLLSVQKYFPAADVILCQESKINFVYF